MTNKDVAEGEAEKCFVVVFLKDNRKCSLEGNTAFPGSVSREWGGVQGRKGDGDGCMECVRRKTKMVTPREISWQMTRVSKVQISGTRTEDGAKNSLNITCEICN